MQRKHQQGKYISCIKGKILDVVVDCRKKSKTFGKHYKIILSEKVNSAGPEFFCLCRKIKIPYIEGPVIHFRRPSGDGLFNSLPKFIFGVFSFFKYIIRLKRKYNL